MIAMSESVEGRVERPPPPLVKTPLLRRFGGVPPRALKVGRGYSSKPSKKRRLN